MLDNIGIPAEKTFFRRRRAIGEYKALHKSPSRSSLRIDCASCRARPDGLCQGSSPEILQTIAKYKSGAREIRAGQDLLTIGKPWDAIYNLEGGWAFLYKILRDGRRQILHFVLPGAVLGFNPSKEPLATYGIQALTDIVVCVIPHHNLVPVARTFPDIAMRLASLISRDRNLSYDQLTNVGCRTAYERVAHLILELYVRYRLRWPGARNEEMNLPLTQEHIGDAVGLTSVHVNRVLRELREKQVLSLHYRHLCILDPDELVNAAAIDPQVLLSWIPDARKAPES